MVFGCDRNANETYMQVAGHDHCVRASDLRGRPGPLSPMVAPRLRNAWRAA